MRTMDAGFADFIRRNTSTPSIPGRTISSRINSGLCSSKTFRASSPDPAVNTSYPSARKPREMVRKASSSSSTTSTLYGIATLSFHNRPRLYFATQAELLNGLRGPRFDAGLSDNLGLLLFLIRLLFGPQRQCEGHGCSSAHDAVDAHVSAMAADVGVADA